MRKFLIPLILLTIAVAVSAQSLPSALRVKTDANDYLLVVGATQTLPLSQPTVFTNTRLKTDANGYLQVVLTGGTISGQILEYTSIDCSAPPYSFTGRTTTGLASLAVNTWNLCGGGTLGLSGNTTSVTSSLPLALTLGTITTDLQSISNTVTWNNAGVTFTNWKQIITDTASNAASLIVDFQIASGGTKFKVNKGGEVFSRTAANINLVLTSVSSVATLQAQNDAGNTLNEIRIRGSNVNLTPNSQGVYLNSSLFIGQVAPSVPVACTTPTVTWSNGTITFQIDVGSSCTGITTLALTMPASTNGWSCDTKNLSNPATSNPKQSAGTTTSVTITNYSQTTGVVADWTAGDDIRFTCTGG